MIELTGQVRVRRLTGTINIIAGEGGGGPLQAKTVYPSHSEQVVSPDEDYYGLVAVTVKAVPRLPACEVSVESGEPNVVENVVNIGAAVSVRVQRYETVETQIEYETHAGTWFFYSGGIGGPTMDPVVVYYFPVKKGATYTVTMTEVGNRLNRALSSVDPLTITTEMSGILSDFIDDSASLAAGYVFTYTATADGWYMLYVSNQDGRPVIDVISSEQVLVDEI